MKIVLVSKADWGLRMAKTAVLLQKHLFTAFLSRMSQKIQHMHFEDNIWRKFANEDKLQVMQPWLVQRMVETIRFKMIRWGEANVIDRNVLALRENIPRKMWIPNTITTRNTWAQKQVMQEAQLLGEEANLIDCNMLAVRLPTIPLQCFDAF